MSDGLPIGGASGAAKAFFEMLRDLLRPFNEKRLGAVQADNVRLLAIAEGEGSVIKALGERVAAGVAVMNTEEAVRQFGNRAAIIGGTVPLLEGKAGSAGEFDPDWFFALYEQCKNIGNPEMQSVYSRILAGEFLNPGSYSLRTLDFLRTMSARDAALFTKTCGRAVCLPERRAYVIPTSYVLPKARLNRAMDPGGIDHIDRKRLREIGLLGPEDVMGSVHSLTGKRVEYFDFSHTPGQDEAGLRYQTSDELTAIGNELAPIAGASMDRAWGAVVMKGISTVMKVKHGGDASEIMRARWSNPDGEPPPVRDALLDEAMRSAPRRGTD